MGVPLPVTTAMTALANPNVGKPRYNTLADWAGGVALGEDPGLPVAANQAFRSASVAIANRSGGADEADYTPRNQNAKRTAGNLSAGTVGVVDVGRNRGAVAPGQRYPVAGDAAVAAPVVASIAPNTAVHGANPLLVTITGTGFTPYSRVISGGTGAPWDASAQYVSATTMTILLDPRNSVAGTASIAVEDHSVLSSRASTAASSSGSSSLTSRSSASSSSSSVSASVSVSSVAWAA